MSQQFQVSESTISYGAIDDGRAFALIQAVREDVEYPFFEKLVEKTPFSFQEWAQFIHLSHRTMQRYKKEQKSFDPVYSERIIEIIMLYNYGLDVFGEESRLNAWLDSSNLALNGATPRSLLDSSIGIALLKDELTRIEQGILT